jgi:hypothetical protein
MGLDIQGKDSIVYVARKGRMKNNNECSKLLYVSMVLCSLLVSHFFGKPQTVLVDEV